MKLNDKVYDILKWIAIIFFPAVVTLAETVLPVYGVSADIIKIVTVTCGCIGVFIATLIGASSITIANEKRKMIAELSESDDADVETEDDIPVTEEEINDEGI